MNKIQGLLKWCQIQLDEYPNISIKNFTTSWRNGLAFNALVHKFKPDLINYHGLDPNQIYYNNYKAFKTAEIHFGIPALLDPKDMETYECPESLSIITYVSQFYNCLKEMKPEGGYKINKFKNTNNGNSDFENISRASISRLSKLTCTICFEKVFLLERYVADDKLYHRKCYRKHQIKNIDSESEVIGDYLNIYGEINPKLNSNIYVHPIQSFNQKEDVLDCQTTSPVNLLEESGSEEDDEEEYTSESLSSYDNSVNLSQYNSDEENFIVDDRNLDKSLTHADHDNIPKYDENKFPENIDFLRPGRSETDVLNTEKNDTLQININKIAEFDMDVNEQDLERKESTRILYIESNLYSTDKNKIDKISDDSSKIDKVNNCNLLINENNMQIENYNLDNNYLEVNVANHYNAKNKIDIECVKDIKEIKDDFKLKENQESLRETENQLSEVKLRSTKDTTNISSIRPRSQENLIVNLYKIQTVKPVKQRLYIKKRDKKLPYSTFFEVPRDESECIKSQKSNKDNNTELKTSVKRSNDSCKTASTCNSDNKEPSKITEEILQNKKLIKIHDTVDIECESDVSSIEDEDYDCVNPKITRNSIWRKPIINSTVTTKHKSACVPIEGKFRDYAEFKDRLEQLNSKQSEIEIKAREIQQRLWEENSSTPLYESLLAKWLELVEEKDKIFYEENALYSWIKDLKLQEMKLKLEAQIRLLSATGSYDSNKTEKENELVAKLIETVNKRAQLVDAMHEENIRRLEIVKNRQEALEISSLSHDVSPSNQQSKHERYVKNPKTHWNRKTSQF